MSTGKQSDLTRLILGTVSEFDCQDTHRGAPKEAVVSYMAEVHSASEETVESQVFALVADDQLREFQGPSKFAEDEIPKLEREL